MGARLSDGDAGGGAVRGCIGARAAGIGVLAGFLRGVRVMRATIARARRAGRKEQDGRASHAGGHEAGERAHEEVPSFDEEPRRRTLTEARQECMKWLVVGHNASRDWGLRASPQREARHSFVTDE